MNIALDEIRSKAPEGATHYSFKTNQYLRGENGDFDLWINNRWAAIKAEVDFYDLEINFEIKPLN